MIRKIGFCFFIVFFLQVGEARAVTNGFEVLSLRPATDNGHYFGVWGSQTLDQGRWVFGTLATYGYRPFQLTNNGQRVDGILDHTLVEHFLGSVGIFDRWLEAGLDVPVGWWLKFKDPDIVGASWESKLALGDIRLNVKSQFVDIDEHKVGLALVPFISFPTGKGGYYFGNGGFSGGGILAFEGRPHERINIALNAGIMAKRKFDFRNIEKGNQLTGGLGMALDITSNLAVSAEASIKTKLSKPFDNTVETPVEALGGVKYAAGKTGLVISAGGGAGIIRGAEVPKFRAILGLGFDPSRRGEKKGVTQVIKAPEPFCEDVIVHFSPDSVLIENVEEAVMLGKMADYLRANPSRAVRVVACSDKMSSLYAEKVAWYIDMHGGIKKSQIKIETKGKKCTIGDGTISVEVRVISK